MALAWMMDDLAWGEDPNHDGTRETEWCKIANEFTNVRLFLYPGMKRLTVCVGVQAGFREGAAAGKTSALQEGFDAGFAESGVPLGRQVGHARGVAAAFAGLPSIRERATVEKLLDELNSVRLSDIGEELGGRLAEVVQQAEALADEI